MKIYTKTGDGGETGLFGGGRVPKDHERVEAYGAVDEANAVIGVVVADLTDPAVGEMLVEVQDRLFQIGALLATPPEARTAKAIRSMEEEDITRLEEWIDGAEAVLPPLRSFILPGGTISGARLHHARTVLRRAERRVVPMVRADEVDGSALRYLNRLSDFLFVMARLVNHRAGVAETEWTSERGL